jgi:hypothetical protein
MIQAFTNFELDVTRVVPYGGVDATRDLQSSDFVWAWAVFGVSAAGDGGDR